MPGDRKKFKTAREKWQSLKAEAAFSVSPELGRTAIIVSTHANKDEDGKPQEEEREIFRAEGQRLAEQIGESGGDPQVVSARAQEINGVLEDRAVSSIYTIGHGLLAALTMNNGFHYDWMMASITTTHLKTGTFVQRQCGNVTRSFNAPLGLFVVDDARNVHAALGLQLPNELTPDDEAKFQPVFTKSEVRLTDIYFLHPYMVNLPDTSSSPLDY